MVSANRVLAVLIAASAALVVTRDSAAQTAAGTAFTYQGRLNDGGTPADGPYDFRFILYDAEVGGSQQGPTLTLDDVAVVNGLFTTSLDFGAGPFGGDARFLEMAVRPGASSGAYTLLGSRQELKPAPHSVFSQAAPWSGVSGKPAGFADGIDNDVLGGITCTNGQVPKWNGSAWACGTDLDSGGDITGVTAGAGLTGGGASGAVMLSVDFAGAGSALTASRSDHNHFAQFWSGGAAPYGLRIDNATGSGVYGSSSAASGTGSGLRGEGNSITGYGVYGRANATSGQNSGVYGETPSAAGTGVSGRATATTGVTNGVFGWSDSTSGTGVYGYTSATAGAAIGVFGTTASTAGTGVYGSASATAGLPNGVFGQSSASAGTGVFGRNYATTGPSYGVRGETASTDGRGVFGLSTTTSGTTYGVYGLTSSPNGAGVFGGTSVTLGNGVRGETTSPVGSAVVGWARATTGVNYGLFARTDSPAGLAGYFQGNVSVIGSVSKSSGSFKIDHPLDPENKYLYHSFVESPDMMNIYNGNVITNDAGYATVEMPAWFGALNRDFRYQVTVIGQFAQAIVAEEMSDNRFTIRTSLGGVKVSWQVTGIRKDAFAEKHRIPVEEEKPAEERGTYLHPEEHGVPKEKGRNYRLGPKLQPPAEIPDPLPLS